MVARSNSDGLDSNVETVREPAVSAALRREEVQASDVSR